ncbi:MAG: thioesterase family protein [Syntrophotaleaceae bacterium]
MNLYLRLFWMLLRLIFLTEAADLTGVFRRSFRVLPTDCDVNMHLTNGRYFSLLDVARIEHLARMKLLGKLLRRRWMPVLNATEITFIRPLPPLRKFDITTRMVTWDEKYFYLEQRFESGDTLHAVSLARAAFIRRGELVPPRDVALLAGYQGSPPPCSAIVNGWQCLLGDKRDHYATVCPIPPRAKGKQG